MRTTGSFDRPPFRAAVAGLVAVHRLIRVGQGESPEADAIRDTLDGPLEALTEAEAERFGWLSEDLYSISEPTAAEPKALPPQAQQQLIEAVEARDGGDWDLALALLRDWRDHLSPGLLSYLRGTIWSHAGVPEAAVAFYEAASDHLPDNPRYRTAFEGELSIIDPTAARHRSGHESFAQSERVPVIG